MSLPNPMAALVVALGVAFMAALAFGVAMPPDYPFFGSQIYDFYARSLLQGQFDLPARALRIEGHFTPDGAGYLYHGLGPVLTRLPFAPFVALPTAWISPLSILLWAVLGNMCWHAAFAMGLEKARIAEPGTRRLAHLLLAVAVWFGAPGMLLVANGTVYYEPVAMAYALGGGVMLCIVAVAMGRLEPTRVLVPMALLAGLAVHARPHLAVGFYLATLLMAAYAWKGAGRAAWSRIAASLAVLGICGALLLASNAARFGSATSMHGSFEGGDVQYGTVYWGYENPESARARAFEEHGRFNPGRIVPNALTYLATPPEGQGLDGGITAVDRAHDAMARPYGEARMERPRVGALFLWPAWIALMAVGLAQRGIWSMPTVVGMAGAGLGALLLLSYPTVTLRYHIDLWPLIAFPAVFGIAALGQAIERRRGKPTVLAMALPVMLLAGIVVTGDAVGASRNLITEKPGTLSQAWSEDYCLQRVAAKGFAGNKASALCRLGDNKEYLQ